MKYLRHIPYLICVFVGYIGDRISDLWHYLNKPQGCDLCGHEGTEKNPLVSDGWGMRAHQRCWDKANGKVVRRRR